MNIKTNKNDFARFITLKEGKKVSQPIGQVKETLSHIVTEISTWTDEEILKFFKGRRKKVIICN